MPRFIYIARDNIGKEFKGGLEAESESSVRTQLSKIGLYATEIKRSKVRVFGGNADKVNIDDIVIFTEWLSAMINSGLPLIQSLRTISRQAENPTVKKVIGMICLDIEGGHSFSGALEKYPAVFSNFYINLVKAGEASGMLGEALLNVAEYLSKEQTIQRTVRRSFAYPLIVLGASIIVVGFLTVFIVPIFAGVYEKMRISLPLPTIALLAISHGATRYWFPAVISVVLAAYGYKKAYSSDKGRYYIDRFKLGAPIFGPLIRKIAVSRFIRTFASLVASGISIMEALRVVREIAGNRVITDLIDSAQRNIAEGKKITESLGNTDLFPPMVIQMFSAGEESSRLGETLKKASDFLERDIDYSLGKMVSRIEPALTFGLALVIGFIALAIYLPMFDVIASMTK